MWTTTHSACEWYRVIQPGRAMKMAGYPVEVVSVVTPPDQKSEMLFYADVIAMWRNLLPTTVELLRVCRNLQYPSMVVDIDDDVFTVEPQSFHYRNWGLREVKGLPVGDWIDGQTINLALNRRKWGWHKKAYRMADGLSVTTERLAETVRKYNKNVAVLPNCIETGVVTNYIQARSEDVRICYQGDISHRGDIELLTKPMEKCLSKYKNATLIVCGDLWRVLAENLKAITRKCIEPHPEFVPIQAHFYRMMWLQPDMGLIPLIDTEFNRCKSSLKLYEFGAMGVPCVVSRVPPYTDDVPEDAAIFVDNTPEAWEDGINRLATNRDLRKRIGDNARDWVVANRDSVRNAHLWWDFYNELYKAGRERQGLCA